MRCSLFLPSAIVKRSALYLKQPLSACALESYYLPVSATRKIAYVLVSYACAFFLSFWMPQFVHRQDFDRAVDAYVRSPSAENRAALEVQRRENERIRLRDSSIAAILIVAIGYGLRGAYKSTRGRLSRSGPEALKE